MKKIVLIGFATCYKTSVGKLLAEKLGCNFVDTDAEIERACNLTIEQIFDTYGEQYFRQKESELISSLNTNDTVISCGGGTVLACGFEKFVRDSVVVWLTATAETVFSRLGAVSRPLFDGLTVNQLDSYISKRSIQYSKYSNVSFPTDKRTSEQVAEEIYIWLHNVNKN